MKVMVIGSGGREHALCWKIAQSQKVNKLYCAPGNGGTSLVAENVDIKANDIDGLLDFAIKNAMDLTVVGPEEPLVMGIVDKFEDKGLRIFGPNRSCARLEGSKEFAKSFMNKYDIPTAKYKSFSSYQDAVERLDEFSFPLVIKADGLCLGKGVSICGTEEEATNVLKEILRDNKFGKEGDTVVVEEFLEGIEASLLCFVTEDRIIPMESAKDYKKIYENDLGPNTGGIGCFSPSPLFTEKLMKKIQNEILDRIYYGFKSEKLNFKGILYVGLMVVYNDPYVLEFNVRFGDPETEVLMPRLESDIVDLFQKSIDSTLDYSDVKWSDKHCLTVVATSRGYPIDYKKGYEITGCEDLDRNIILFHNGTKYDNGKLLTNGGRVLSITALEDSLQEARKRIYSNIDKINFDGVYYRKDIGK
ncbi:phosphoribosylamine--glycine ligase [Schnuerera sp. xch1]|uniref:phosphoribosylamine--glycine ligase n=1 Tax=Schnuerera sp. xch1 TaxID=2874283 RepID=UPI001CBA8876|nr:phosphoribosylamine--glycine ligase [Schnuerera sp. xch1]MBZ2175502.1 phosphoribosylamine--glycine ligase [Schnuerera sp. xch1]